MCIRDSFEARKRRYEQARAVMAAYPWTGDEPILEIECACVLQDHALRTTPALTVHDAAYKIDLVLWEYEPHTAFVEALKCVQASLLAGDTITAARAFNQFQAQIGDTPLWCDRTWELVIADDLVRFATQRLSA